MVTNMRCYLRTHRRERGLTQQELARLLVGQSRAGISRVERGLRTPSIETAIAASVLFGIPTKELFPELYRDIEERVVEQAYILYQKAKSEQSRRRGEIEKLLQDSIKRAGEDEELTHATV
jgi:transcriptional regulator with XRE-family HTH domain